MPPIALPPRQQEIVAEYDDMAPGYDTAAENCGWQAPKKLVGTLEEQGLIGAGMRVVDFAAGTGALASAFRASGKGLSLRITAKDLSPAMLEQCRAKGVADVLIRQDITQPWPLPPASQDIAAATGVGEYLTDRELGAVIGEAARALKPGGAFAFTFLPVEAEGRASPDAQKRHSVSYVADQCRQHGIALRSAEPFDAYRANDGTTVRQVLALGMKL